MFGTEVFFSIVYRKSMVKGFYRSVEIVLLAKVVSRANSASACGIKSLKTLAPLSQPFSLAATLLLGFEGRS